MLSKFKLIPMSNTIHFLWLVFLLIGLTACNNQEEPTSYNLEIKDPSLKVELIAEQPEIMTPVGLAIDRNDHIYLLESHTHSPSSDYEGPAFDRIKKGLDDNQDGIPERWTVFADSIEDGMNLAIDQDDQVFLTTKNSVVVFQDHDGDHISDEQTILLKMTKPNYVYDHAGILGLTIGPDGWLYISRGNTGSNDWSIEGTDGSTLEGYGDGGNVMRCKKDGSALEEVATGFWNPFDLKFTSEGRLLLTDNDPDSRGPNRLIEIVPGGDYGYQSLYGGSGIHPFLAWNGELPGTLPYAAPLGEAPCALMDAAYTSFGEEYADNILVNVWEENTIVRIPLQKKNSTVVGIPEVLVQGDSSFHPVAFAANSRGDLYFTDWVIRQYPNHGQGRLWRLSAKNSELRSIFSTPGKPEARRFVPLSADFDKLVTMLKSGDRFEKAMARKALIHFDPIKELLADADSELRKQALLVLLKSKDALSKQQLVRLLQDEEPEIRRLTLIYIGKKARTDLKAEMQQALVSGLIGSALFETYLATLKHLQPDFINSYQAKAEKKANKLKRKLPDSFLKSFLKDRSVPESVRALALPFLEDPTLEEEWLIECLKSAENELFKTALIRALKSTMNENTEKEVLRLTLDDRSSSAVRMQAISALTAQSSVHRDEVVAALSATDTLLQYLTVKYLCRCRDNQTIRQRVDQFLASASNRAAKLAWAKCTNTDYQPPSTETAWAELVDGKGNPQRGKLVFQSIQAQCETCHKVDGWGGYYGPDLSHVGSSKSRSQLINAILNPSEEIAPDWQGWYVVDANWKKHYGRQIDVHLKNVELMNQSGEFVAYPKPRSFGILEESLMPEGLEATMTTVEFNDLIAYLESLE